MEECVPLNTKIIYSNDEGNILHIIKYNTLLKQVVLGVGVVDKQIKIDTFDHKRMKKNIINQKKYSYRAEKNIFNKITIYKGKQEMAIIKKQGYRFIVYIGPNIQMIIRTMTAATYPMEWVIEYKIDSRDYIYLTSAHYRWTGFEEEYIANYSIIQEPRIGICSDKNTIIRDKDDNNKIEVLELNDKLFKIAYDKPISELDSFIFGAILLFETV